MRSQKMSKKNNTLIEHAFKKNLSEFESNFKRLMKERVALTVQKHLFENDESDKDEKDFVVVSEEDDEDLKSFESFSPSLQNIPRSPEM